MDRLTDCPAADRRHAATQNHPRVTGVLHNAEQMRPDDTMLYEHFLAARSRAIEVTDQYRDTAADDPRRAVLWQDVVHETEAARTCLEDWLRLAEEAGRPSTSNQP